MRKAKKILGLALTAGLIIALVLSSGCSLLGTTPPAEGQQQQGGIEQILPLIIFLVLIFGMFYFLMVRPQRKKQKDQQELLSQLRKGDKVLTAGGMYGVIESSDQDTVVIKVESGALIRVARGSIIQKRQA